MNFSNQRNAFMPLSKPIVGIQNLQSIESCQPVELSAPISLQDQAFTIAQDEQYQQFFDDEVFNGRNSSPPINQELVLNLESFLENRNLGGQNKHPNQPIHSTPKYNDQQTTSTNQSQKKLFPDVRYPMQQSTSQFQFLQQDQSQQPFSVREHSPNNQFEAQTFIDPRMASETQQIIEQFDNQVQALCNQIGSNRVKQMLIDRFLQKLINSTDYDSELAARQEQDVPFDEKYLVQVNSQHGVNNAVRQSSRSGVLTPMAFNPGLSPIGTSNCPGSRMDSFMLNQIEMIKSQEHQRCRNSSNERKQYTKQEARKSGERMYQSFLKKQNNLEVLKRKREQEIKATMKKKPTICKKSVRITEQLTQRERDSQGQFKSYGNLSKFLNKAPTMDNDASTSRQHSRHYDCLKSFAISENLSQEETRHRKACSQQKSAGHLPITRYEQDSERYQIDLSQVDSIQRPFTNRQSPSMTTQQDNQCMSNGAFDSEFEIQKIKSSITEIDHRLKQQQSLLEQRQMPANESRAQNTSRNGMQLDLTNSNGLQQQQNTFDAQEDPQLSVAQSIAQGKAHKLPIEQRIRHQIENLKRAQKKLESDEPLPKKKLKRQVKQSKSISFLRPRKPSKSDIRLSELNRPEQNQEVKKGPGERDLTDKYFQAILRQPSQTSIGRHSQQSRHSSTNRTTSACRSAHSAGRRSSFGRSSLNLIRRPSQGSFVKLKKQSQEGINANELQDVSKLYQNAVNQQLTEGPSKLQASKIYSIAKNQLPMYERNQAWALSREITLATEREAQQHKNTEELTFKPNIQEVKIKDQRPHLEFYRYNQGTSRSTTPRAYDPLAQKPQATYAELQELKRQIKKRVQNKFKKGTCNRQHRHSRCSSPQCSGNRKSHIF